MASVIRAYAVVMLIIVAAGVVMSGCTSTPPATSSPTITIASPLSGATVPPGNVTVTVQVKNFTVVDKQGQAKVSGEGHVHFYMDVSPLPSDPTKPAIPANASAVWAHVSGTTYTFTNVTPGAHTFSVQLANNDHTPVSPIVTDSITITVTGPSGTPSVKIVSPQEGASVSTGNVTVNAQVGNFVVVDKQGQASIPGEGHLHFYMDVSPLPSDPSKPAIPTDANAAWAHVSGTTYTFTNVTPGAHTFSVQLANNDHTPVSPITTDSVRVTAAGFSTGLPTIATTTTGTTTSGSGSSGY